MKDMYGFKADKKVMEFIDKLVSLTQYGMTETNYKTRSDFILAAISREARRLYDEIDAAPMLTKLLEALYDVHDGEILQGFLAGTVDEEESTDLVGPNNKGQPQSEAGNNTG